VYVGADSIGTKGQDGYQPWMLSIPASCESIQRGPSDTSDIESSRDAQVIRTDPEIAEVDGVFQVGPILMLIPQGAAANQREYA
jgi:hypothetical protein